MSQVALFHAWNEPDKGHPRYHIDDACPVVQRIPRDHLRPGSGGFYLCEQCAKLHGQALSDRRQTLPGRLRLWEPSPSDE